MLVHSTDALKYFVKKVSVNLSFCRCDDNIYSLEYLLNLKQAAQVDVCDETGLDCILIHT